MEVYVMKMRSVLTMMVRSLAFAKMATQEMGQFVLVSYLLESTMQLYA